MLFNKYNVFVINHGDEDSDIIVTNMPKQTVKELYSIWKDIIVNQKPGYVGFIGGTVTDALVHAIEEQGYTVDFEPGNEL